MISKNLDMRCTKLTVTWYNPPHDYSCLHKANKHTRTYILTQHPSNISMVCQVCLSVFSDKLFPCTSSGQSYGLYCHFMRLLVRVDVRILATLITHIPTPNTIPLTHWGRVTHICVANLTTIDSDNGLSPGRRQAIVWTNVGILLIEPLGTNFSDILIEVITFSVKKMHLKMSSGNLWPFCLGLNELSIVKQGPC